MSRDTEAPEAPQQLVSWLAANRAPLHLCWNLLTPTDILVLRGVSKEMAATANKYLSDIPHLLRLLKTLSNTDSSPAGACTWASVEFAFCDCNRYGTYLDGSACRKPCSCGVGGGSGGGSSAAPAAADMESVARVPWTLAIDESETTSDTEDSDYDPFEQGARWSQDYCGECVALCPTAEFFDCDGSVPALTSDPSTFFFGPPFKFVVGTERDSSKRTGRFWRKVEHAPTVLPSRLEACRATGAIWLRVLVPLAAGGCNDGTCGPKWLALVPSRAETGERFLGEYF